MMGDIVGSRLLLGADAVWWWWCSLSLTLVVSPGTFRSPCTFYLPLHKPDFLRSMMYEIYDYIPVFNSSIFRTHSSQSHAYQLVFTTQGSHACYTKLTFQTGSYDISIPIIGPNQHHRLHHQRSPSEDPMNGMKILTNDPRSYRQIHAI